MSAPVLGVDPGREGGACLLGADGRTVLLTVHWRPTGDDERRGYLLSSSVADVFSRLPSLSAVGTSIAERVRQRLGELRIGDPPTLCCEGLFVHPQRVHGVIELAETTGELIGPLRELTDVEPLRPRAAVWRPAILGIAANTPADRAEAVAVHAVRLGLVRGLPELTDGHVAEAACIARWGWVQGQQASQLALAGGRRG